MTADAHSLADILGAVKAVVAILKTRWMAKTVLPADGTDGARIVGIAYLARRLTGPELPLVPMGHSIPRKAVNGTGVVGRRVVRATHGDQRPKDQR